MIGQTLSHYHVTAALGAGGMGEVYRATDTKLGRDVAIKVLPTEVAQDEGRLARFRREAQLLAALNHPSIGAIYGLEEAGGRSFLVLELVEGVDLKQRLEGGAIPVDEAVETARQIAEALEEAHAKGIVHRDLKPSNVMLTPGGKVKVLDFGLAKAYEGDPASGGSSSDLSQSPTLAHTGTQAGVILGTAAYMSPEQASGKAVDKRADIWSFGVVLFEMLTGRRLFSGESVAETLASVLKGDPPWDELPTDCPPALMRLLRRCLQRRTRERLQDIGDARLELADTSSVDERELGGRRVVAPPTWRRALPWGLAAGLAVACLALAFRSAPEPELTRLDVAPPRGTRIAGLAFLARPAVSPDGRMLAFSAWDAERRSQLYVRPFDAAEARVLAGTDGATLPFWSPDSRRIGFFADGQLKTIEATGGAPVSLCDAPMGRGGSWSPEGAIVFSPNYTGPLHRVADEGGEPSPVTNLDSSRDDSHRFPHFLPDGRRFLYLARVSDEVGEGHAVRVGSLDSDEEKLLLRSAAAATYTSGHLLYLREGSLRARPLDLNRLVLTGEETPLAEGVGLHSAAGYAAFSASPIGVLAYLSHERQSRATLEWLDRDGTNVGTLGDPAAYQGGRLSPDGTRAAIAIGDSHQVPDLWIYDISREVRTRFTFSPRWDVAATWSPDGRDLVFSSARKGHLDLYRKTVEGSGEAEPLLVSEREKIAMDISPDGKLLAFQQLGPDGNEDLWVLPLHGDGEPRPFLETKFDETSGVFSPDGRWMAYGSDESERKEVYVAAFPSGDRKQQVSTEGGVKPQWRRDGREIYYQGLDGTLMAVKVEVTAERLVVGETERLFQMLPDVSPAPTYSPTPDGQRFLVITPVESEASNPLTVVLNWPRLLE